MISTGLTHTTKELVPNDNYTDRYSRWGKNAIDNVYITEFIIKHHLKQNNARKCQCKNHVYLC